MHIADAHCDFLYKFVGQRELPYTVTPETLAAGSVQTQVFAAFVDSAREADPPAAYFTQVDAFDRVRRMTAHLPGFTPVLAIEGGEALGGSLSALYTAAQRGVRILTLTWNYENELGYPHTRRGGLKPFGRQAVEVMAALHIAPDVSHLNEDGFWDLCDLNVPFMASHSCARALCGHSRNLTDAQARAIIQRNGFIGVNFCPAFLRDDGNATLEDAARHVLHFLSLGGENVVGFGSDFDGIGRTPVGLSSPADFPALLSRLSRLGVSDTVLEKVAHGNFDRFMSAL